MLRRKTSSNWRGVHDVERIRLGRLRAYFTHTDKSTSGTDDPG
ncbi:hypothetical protein [Hyphomonas sp. UBA1923]|nr:hypothetical protein [Hyphomonas sp. UBA1923]